MNRAKVIQIVAWLTGNKKAHYILLLLQTISGGAAVCYTIYPQSQEISAILFSIGISIVIIWMIFVLLVRRHYGINVLICELETGVLYDKGTDIENVSLRRKTMTKLLNGFLNTKKPDRASLLREIAYSIGKDFVEDYRRYLRKRRPKQLKELNKKKLIEEIFQYDSSSGMGKFVAERMEEKPDDFVQVAIRNAFTCENSVAEKSTFMTGYLEGILEAVFQGRKFKAIAQNANECQEVLRISIIEKITLQKVGVKLKA